MTNDDAERLIRQRGPMTNAQALAVLREHARLSFDRLPLIYGPTRTHIVEGLLREALTVTDPERNRT